MISQKSVFMENMCRVLKNSGISYLLLTLQRFRKKIIIYIWEGERMVKHKWPNVNNQRIRVRDIWEFAVLSLNLST